MKRSPTTSELFPRTITPTIGDLAKAIEGVLEIKRTEKTSQRQIKGAYLSIFKPKVPAHAAQTMQTVIPRILASVLMSS